MLDTKYNIIFLAFNVLLLAIITFQYISLKNSNSNTLDSSPTPLPESQSPTPLPESQSPTPLPESQSPTPLPELQSPTPLPESQSPTPLPESQSNEPDIPLNVFDVDLYYSLYSDLQNAFGYNVKALNNHYWKYGIYEGRKMSYVFNAFYYYANYKDLQATTFPTFSGLYTHFFTIGIKEGRAGTHQQVQQS